jgi:hypothetical protein
MDSACLLACHDCDCLHTLSTSSKMYAAIEGKYKLLGSSGHHCHDGSGVCQCFVGVRLVSPDDSSSTTWCQGNVGRSGGRRALEKVSRWMQHTVIARERES